MRLFLSFYKSTTKQIRKDIEVEIYRLLLKFYISWIFINNCWTFGRLSFFNLLINKLLCAEKVCEYHLFGRWNFDSKNYTILAKVLPAKESLVLGRVEAGLF